MDDCVLSIYCPSELWESFEHVNMMRRSILSSQFVVLFVFYRQYNFYFIMDFVECVLFLVSVEKIRSSHFLINDYELTSSRI